MERLKSLFSRQVIVAAVEASPTPVEHAISSPIADVAARYFDIANMDCPASTTGQAAKIAMLCKQDLGQLPGELMGALLSDEERIDKLVNKANNLHTSRGSGPKSEEGEVVFVDSVQMRQVITQSFQWAQRMMVLDEQELTHILALYPGYMELNHKGMGREAEIHYRFEAQEMVNAKQLSET